MCIRDRARGWQIRKFVGPLLVERRQLQAPVQDQEARRAAQPKEGVETSTIGAGGSKGSQQGKRALKCEVPGQQVAPKAQGQVAGKGSQPRQRTKWSHLSEAPDLDALVMAAPWLPLFDMLLGAEGAAPKAQKITLTLAMVSAVWLHSMKFLYLTRYRQIPIMLMSTARSRPTSKTAVAVGKVEPLVPKLEEGSGNAPHEQERQLARPRQPALRNCRPVGMALPYLITPGQTHVAKPVRRVSQEWSRLVTERLRLMGGLWTLAGGVSEASERRRPKPPKPEPLRWKQRESQPPQEQVESACGPATPKEKAPALTVAAGSLIYHDDTYPTVAVVQPALYGISPGKEAKETQTDHYLDDSFPEGAVPMAESPTCLLYTSPSPRDRQKSRMPSSA